jgi:hypothetical protein
MSRPFEGMERCVGCSLRYREKALNDEGLCPECDDEDGLENYSDLEH